jgi:predicted house-cleaning noncanonical NTP pyrophosphatase (MazG superfamily)
MNKKLVSGLKKEKLVRDKIPEIIQNEGGAVEVRIASGGELDLLLRKKILEEAKELLKESTTEEIVDLLEAVDALLFHRKIDDGMLDIHKHAKRLARGGFTKGFVVTLDNLED